MTAQQLPERPNLEQLKRQAKDLLQAAHRGETSALARFRKLPAFATTRDGGPSPESLALHDAQSVVAREYGFDSWNALRERVEELTLEFGAAVDQFIEAATDGRTGRAERLLELYPRIANANFTTALLAGDAAAAESRLAQTPALAVERGGPRDWEPLLYVCHTSAVRGSAARREGLVAIARRLIGLGADPNARFPWLHHGVRRPVLWGAACATRVLALTEVLLEAGADPNDGVTLALAASGGDLGTLEALLAHGADVNQAWATDGSASVYAILSWSTTPDGVLWLLEHGADPDPVFAPNGETPMHAVARGWDAAMAEAFVRRGADATRPRADGRTPYAVAELNANRSVADWLIRNGAATALSDVDRLVAACSRGDRASAEAMLRDRPGLRDAIESQHYHALYLAAERGDTNALETMLSCGFDANRPDDEIGKTALHVAAMEGRPDAVRVLLAHGASVAARDREFHGQPLIWAAEGSRTEHRQGGRHAEVGRPLLDAGSPVDWDVGAEPSEGILDILEGWRRARANGS